MANTSSPGRRAGGCCRRCTRGDLLTAALAAMLCSASYCLSIWHNSRGAADASLLGPAAAATAATTTSCGADDELDFESHHTAENAGLSVSVSSATATTTARRALRVEAPRAGAGYRGPFPWPASRAVVWAGNSAGGAAAAGGEGWAVIDGDNLRFTDAAAVRAYASAVFRLLPARPRTALDVGAMHAGSWGAEALSRGVLAMSTSPEDALVELALERGVPAMLASDARRAGHRQPYPDGAYDMAHCGRCLPPRRIPATTHRFLTEMDRVIRRGGYWVHSGAPRGATLERAGGESAAASLCWRKVADQNGIAVWQKPVSRVGCDADAGEAGIMPMQEAGVPREPAAETLRRDGETWRKRVARYKAAVTQLGQKGRYRNLLDMNAHLGGFAAALAGDPVWVMNVVPSPAPAPVGGDAGTDTLVAIYERGLIGAYHDWCEPMPTPAMSYDLLHADSLFNLYKDRCDLEVILLEVDRILRPDRAMIIRDDIAVLSEIKTIIADRMRWDSQIVDGEDGAGERYKILLAVKPYWNDQDRNEEQ